MEEEQVAGGSSGENCEQEQDEETVESLGSETETEESVESATTEEGEVLEVVLDEQFDQDQPEGVGSEPLAD